MGASFFVGWALWQKLTFILAGAIVLTFTVGLCKLWYDNRRLQKYAKVADRNASAPEILEAQTHAIQEEKNNAIPPFGIRAIERGLEVDGVWISRPNTPVPGSPASYSSFGSSLQKTGSTSTTAIPHIELPEPAHASSYTPSFRGIPSQRPHGPRLCHRPLSPAIHQQSLHMERPCQDSPSMTTSTFPNSMMASVDSYDAYATSEASESIYYSPKTSLDSVENPDNCVRINVPHHQVSNATERSNLKAALDLLHTHRLSHVAETGQLTPRTRRPGYSGEWASMADFQNHADTFDMARTRTPSPADPLTEMSNPFTTPSSSSRSSPETPPTSQDNTEVLQQHDNIPKTPNNYSPDHAAPRQPDKNAMTYLTPPSARDQNKKSSSKHRRSSQILRKVNSGFDILRPGRFKFASHSPDTTVTFWDSEKKKSKRLQKRTSS